MQLIGTLASGVAGAENGYARIFVRGSSKRARYFSDFEGDNAIDGSDVQLDVNGGAVIYVNITVDVLVYGENDQLVRRWIESSTAACVELISPSFTGADYETGVGGTNKPTTVAAAFDRLIVSFGAEDFLVLMPDGSKVTMQEAIASVNSVFFNVRSPLFGAVGDGVAPDGVAIMKAVTAASDAEGGVVFFPAGHYFMGTTQLVVPGNVSLLGAGPKASRLMFGVTASPSILAGSGGAFGHGVQTIQGLSIGANHNGAAALLEVVGESRLSIRSCLINSTGGIGVSVPSAGTHVMVDDCDFTLSNGAPAVSAQMAIRAGRVDVRRSRFSLLELGATVVLTGANIHVFGCRYDGSSSPTNTTFLSAVSGIAAYGSMRCCEIIDSPTRSVVGMAIGSAAVSTTWFVEDGNFLSGLNAASRLYSGTIAAATQYYRLGTRESRMVQLNTATAVITLTPVMEYGIFSVRSTFAGNISISIDSVTVPNGIRIRLILVNGDAVARTLTFGTGARGGTYVISANEAIGFEMVRAMARNNVGSDIGAWYVVGTSGVLTSGPDSSYPV